ncbi:hypothetical protein BSKO_01467 [Bryopsis sp. KO-2023]|nr:hypothetical protein BSKO_01467 [Bryopsis sp. KO-2023]
MSQSATRRSTRLAAVESPKSMRVDGDSESDSGPASSSSGDDEMQVDARKLVTPVRQVASRGGKSPGRGRGSRGRGRGRGGSAGRRPNIDLTDLFEVAKNSVRAFSFASEAWVKLFKEDSNTAIAQIINFMGKASGCTPDFKGSDVEALSMEEVLNTLRDTVGMAEGPDPFKAKGPKSMRVSFPKLWDRLIMECNSGGLTFDENLIRHLCDLLIPMACDPIRRFRFSATLAVCQLLTSWITVMGGLMEARETAQRHLAAEERKKETEAVKEKKSVLKRTVDRSHRQVSDVKDVINTFFNGVFSHRFRDVDPEIRTVVISALGKWCAALPSEFLSDNYLKYVAWAMSDRAPVVRLAAVKALLNLYEDDDNALPLHEFTVRFNTRMCELVDDIDDDVAVQGVKILTKLVRAEELPFEAVRDIYKLLLDESPSLRHAAAELVCELLDEEVHKASVQSGESKSEEDVHLHGVLKLMDMLASSEGESENSSGDVLERHMVVDIVDALYERLDVFRDWATILRWLNDDFDEFERTPTMLTHLVILLDCCVGRAVGVEQGGVHEERRTRGKVKRRGAGERDLQDITLSIMKEIGNLIATFLADGDKTASLVKLVRYMKLELYVLKREEDAFEALLRKISSGFFRHHKEAVLEQCILTIVFAASHGPQELRERSRVVLSECIKELLTNLESACEDLRCLSEIELASSSGAETTHPCLVRLNLATRRTLAFLSVLQSIDHPCTLDRDRVYRLLNDVLGMAAGNPIIATSVASPALMCFELMLLLVSARSETEQDGSMEELVKESGRLVDCLTQILAGDLPHDVEVCWKVVEIMFDLHAMWSIDKVRGTKYESLGFRLRAASFSRLWEVVEERLEWSQRMAETDEAGSGENEGGHSKAGANAVIDTLSQLRRFLVTSGLPDECLKFAAHFVQFLVGQPEEVTDIIRHTLKLIRKEHPTKTATIYLQAMRLSYETACSEEEERDPATRWQHFMDLSKKIAQTYVAVQAAPSRASVVAVVSDGAEYGMQAPPSRLSFLEGLVPFVPKTNPRDAADIVQKLEEISQASGRDDADDSWAPFVSFLTALKERAVRQPLRGALKKTEPPGERASLKIHFAGGSAQRSGGERLQSNLSTGNIADSGDTTQISEGGSERNTANTGSMQLAEGSGDLQPVLPNSGSRRSKVTHEEEYLSEMVTSGRMSAGKEPPPSTPVSKRMPTFDIGSGTKRPREEEREASEHQDEQEEDAMEEDEIEEPPPRPKRTRKNR